MFFFYSVSYHTNQCYVVMPYICIDEEVPIFCFRWYHTEAVCPQTAIIVSFMMVLCSFLERERASRAVDCLIFTTLYLRQNTTRSYKADSINESNTIAVGSTAVLLSTFRRRRNAHAREGRLWISISWLVLFAPCSRQITCCISCTWKYEVPGSSTPKA